METAQHLYNVAKYYTEESVPNLITLFNHVYKDKEIKTKEVNTFIGNLNGYNENTRLLEEKIKKGEDTEIIRWKLVDNLTLLRKDIFFLVDAIYRERHIHNDESLRLLLVDKTIKKLTNHTLSEISTIKKNQEIINKIALFSSDGKLVNFERSTNFWEADIIDSSYEILKNDYPEVLQLYEAKIAMKSEKPEQK